MNRPNPLIVLLLMAAPMCAAEPNYLGQPLPDWLDKLRSPDIDLRRAAANVLSQNASPDARDALPLLFETLKDDDREVRLAVGRALRRIDAKAVQQAITQLIESARDPKPPERSAALTALGDFAAESRSVEPALIAGLKDASPIVRIAAARSLARVNPRAALVSLSELVNDARSSEAAVRAAAAGAIGDLGPSAKPALPVLIELLKDARPQVKIEAAGALRKMSFIAKPAAIPALTAALKDTDITAAVAAAHALGKIDKASAIKSVPVLVDALKDASARGPSARALIDLGPSASTAIPRLTASLTDADKSLAVAAALTLHEIDPKAGPAALATLVAALKEGDPSVRAAAANGLAAFGAEAKPTVPTLIDLLHQKDNILLRMSVVAALGKIGPTAVPALIEALKDTDPEVQSGASEALGSMGPDAKPAVPDLIGMFKASTYLRGFAVTALVKIGPGAVPALINALKDANAATRTAAIEALGEIGPKAKPAVPALTALLKDSDPTIQQPAAAALKQIGMPLR